MTKEQKEMIDVKDREALVKLRMMARDAEIVAYCDERIEMLDIGTAIVEPSELKVGEV